MEVNTGFGPIDVAISGMRAQKKNIDVISSNVANAQTTDNGDGEPYRRLEAVFKTDDDETGGVVLDEVVPDMSKFMQKNMLNILPCEIFKFISGHHKDRSKNTKHGRATNLVCKNYLRHFF